MGMAMETNRRMRVVMYSAQSFERTAFESALDDLPGNELHLDIVYVSAPLNDSTAALASGARALCLFVTDRADAPMLRILHAYGVELITLRYAGRATVDLEKALELGLRVARVPTHSPNSIADYAVTLMLTLNRKLHLGANRVRDGNLSLHGLVGFDLADKRVGVLGAGKVGRRVVKLLRAFGSTVLVYDAVRVKEVEDLGARYVTLEELLRESDIITLHAPLVPSTRHIIGRQTLSKCKPGVHVINTARGALVDTSAVLAALRSGQVGALGIDVFEGETEIFFTDNTGVCVDPVFQILKSLPNVIVTGHQGALTTGALSKIAKATIHTLQQLQKGVPLEYGIAANAL